MKKVFEDEFSAIQEDMIQICLEYVEKIADIIYIYGSFEENTISCDFFYQIEGKIYERHKLSQTGKAYDTSIQRQKACMRILNDDMKKMIGLCNQYQMDMPTEIKLIYDVNKNSVVANYQYIPVYSQNPDETPDDMAQRWLEEEKLKGCNTTKKQMAN